MLSEPSEVGRCGFANSQLSTWQGGDSCEQTTQGGGSPEGGLRLETTPDRLDEVYLPIGFLPIFSSTKSFRRFVGEHHAKGAATNIISIQS